MIRFVHFLRRLHCLLLKFMGGKIIGARALVLSKNEKEVLLVYHTYCPNWHLPGGGVDQGEHPLHAVKREVLEEAGILCLKDPDFFGVYYQEYLNVDDYPFVYVIKDFKESHAPLSQEIRSVRWFDIKDLPEDMDPGSLARIEEYTSKKEPNLFWNKAH